MYKTASKKSGYGQVGSEQLFLAGTHCYHPFLKKGKIPGEKVCCTCGRTIYAYSLPINKD